MTGNEAQQLRASIGLLGGLALPGPNFAHRKSGPGRKHNRGKQNYQPAQPESAFKPHCWERTRKAK